MRFQALSAVAVLTLAMQAQAGALIPAKTIQLDVDSSINLADYKASMSILCSREVTGFWDHSENCGSYSIDVAISSDGKITFPEVEDFAHVGGSDLSNMQMSISLSQKANPKVVATVYVDGAGAFAKFNAEQSKLKLINQQAASIEMDLNGVNIAGSAMAQNPNASLDVQTSVMPKQGVTDDLSVGSSNTYDVDFYNDPKMGGPTLSSFVTLKTPSGPLAYFEDDVPTFSIFAMLTVSNGPGQGETTYEGSVTFSADAGGLAKVKVINMTQNKY